VKRNLLIRMCESQRKQKVRRLKDGGGVGSPKEQ